MRSRVSLEPEDHLNGPDPTNEEIAARMRAWLRGVVFVFGYACVVGLVLGAILVITRDGRPLDEKALVQKWDRALQRLGLDF